MQLNLLVTQKQGINGQLSQHSPRNHLRKQWIFWEIADVLPTEDASRQVQDPPKIALNVQRHQRMPCLDFTRTHEPSSGTTSSLPTDAKSLSQRKHPAPEVLEETTNGHFIWSGQPHRYHHPSHQVVPNDHGLTTGIASCPIGKFNPGRHQHER